MTIGLLGLPPQDTVSRRRFAGASTHAGQRPVRWNLAFGGVRQAATTVIRAAVVVLVALLVAVIAGGAFGYRVLAIKSGSMVPTLHVGDLVVSHLVPPQSARAGQIVTFRDPYLGQALVTHRVVSVSESQDQVHFVTKGDANTVAEHWSIAPTGTISVAIAHIPAMGYLDGLLDPPVVSVIAIGMVTVWVGLLLVRWTLREDAPVPQFP